MPKAATCHRSNVKIQQPMVMKVNSTFTNSMPAVGTPPPEAGTGIFKFTLSESVCHWHADSESSLCYQIR